jgi:hypothetical protein
MAPFLFVATTLVFGAGLGGLLAPHDISVLLLSVGAPGLLLWIVWYLGIAAPARVLRALLDVRGKTFADLVWQTHLSPIVLRLVLLVLTARGAAVALRDVSVPHTARTTQFKLTHEGDEEARADRNAHHPAGSDRRSERHATHTG